MTLKRRKTRTLTKLFLAILEWTWIYLFDLYFASNYSLKYGRLCTRIHVIYLTPYHILWRWFLLIHVWPLNLGSYLEWVADKKSSFQAATAVFCIWNAFMSSLIYCSVHKTDLEQSRFIHPSTSNLNRAGYLKHFALALLFFKKAAAPIRDSLLMQSILYSFSFLGSIKKLLL